MPDKTRVQIHGKESGNYKGCFGYIIDEGRADVGRVKVQLDIHGDRSGFEGKWVKRTDATIM